MLSPGEKVHTIGERFVQTACSGTLTFSLKLFLSIHVPVGKTQQWLMSKLHRHDSCRVFFLLKSAISYV